MFALSYEAIDADEWVAKLGPGLDAGALVCFEGRVRNHHQGKAVRSLDYEAHEALALDEGERIVKEAQQRFPVQAACVHRLGSLKLGEVAVWVGVAGSHRDEAFAACRWIIDEIKARVPIWKREYYEQGEAVWQHP